MHKHACNGGKPDLTSSDLTNYYNEFVLQLKLAEYNFNTAIKKEIKDDITESLKKQEQIIKLLNESIIPALGSTVSYYS